MGICQWPNEINTCLDVTDLHDAGNGD
jgi:hypothetical protein